MVMVMTQQNDSPVVSVTVSKTFLHFSHVDDTVQTRRSSSVPARRVEAYTCTENKVEETEENKIRSYMRALPEKAERANDTSATNAPQDSHLSMPGLVMQQCSTSACKMWPGQWADMDDMDPEPLGLETVLLGAGPCRKHEQTPVPTLTKPPGVFVSRDVARQENKGATTLMINSMPCCVGMPEVLDAMDALGFFDTYDLVYMPGRATNKGYCFVNFHTADLAQSFLQRVDKMVFPKRTSKKVCIAKTALHQGFSKNFQVHSKNSGCLLTFKKGRPVASR